MKNFIWIKIAALLWVVSGCLIFGCKKMPSNWKPAIYNALNTK